MNRIEVGRYEHKPGGWDGWIAPRGGSGELPPWVVFVPVEGEPELHVCRDGYLFSRRELDVEAR